MTNQEIELAEEIAGYYNDPLGFTLFVFPWGREGPLERFTGPTAKQERFLIDLGDEIRARRFNGMDPVRPIRMAISSGHGVGKTALIGMLALFVMSTRNHMRGTVTANTEKQLSTKTWAAIVEWRSYAINKHWFEVNSERFWRVGDPANKSTWFMHPQTCNEENSEAFAGQHARQSSSIYMFDEASNVPDKIWEVAEGGLVKGEPWFLAFGNPTRREGKFFQINFGTDRNFWNKGTLGPTADSQDPAGTRVWSAEDSEVLTDVERESQQEQREFYGFDSDFYRVRVRGLPPMAGDTQFIPADLISAAKRRPARYLPDDPLIIGVDLSWGGNDPACIRFRRGMDARSIPPIVIPGAQTKDDAVIVMKLADVLSREWHGRKVDMAFIDSAGTCGNICYRLRELGHMNIQEINFMGFSPDPKYAFMRSYMWGQLKNALPYLAIDGSPNLEADLSAPGFKLTKHTEILLEPKQDIIGRLGHSTDDGDALALTFARAVKSKQANDETARKRAQERSQIGAWT